MASSASSASASASSSSAATMRAVRVSKFGGPEVYKVEDVPIPEPAAGQVLVRVECAGINPADTYRRSGMYGQMPFPYTPGTDGAGIVEKVGDGVTMVKPGDRVYLYGSMTGTFAQYTLCKEFSAQKLPDFVSYEQGAAIYVPYRTAFKALFQNARAVAGQSVLVHGASGGVGIAAVQFARAAGLVVIGTASTPEGQKLVLDEGAHHVLNHTQPGYLDQVKALTANQGVNIIIENCAHINLGNDLKVIAPGAIVVVVGSRGDVTITPRDLMKSQAVIVGMFAAAEDTPDWYTAADAISKGLLSKTLRPIIGQRFPLDKVADADVEVIEHKLGTNGKVIIAPWE